MTSDTHTRKDAARLTFTHRIRLKRRPTFRKDKWSAARNSSSIKFTTKFMIITPKAKVDPENLSLSSNAIRTDIVDFSRGVEEYPQLHKLHFAPHRVKGYRGRKCFTFLQLLLIQIKSSNNGEGGSELRVTFLILFRILSSSERRNPHDSKNPTFYVSVLLEKCWSSSKTGESERERKNS